MTPTGENVTAQRGQSNFLKQQAFLPLFPLLSFFTPFSAVLYPGTGRKTPAIFINYSPSLQRHFISVGYTMLRGDKSKEGAKMFERVFEGTGQKIWECLMDVVAMANNIKH